MRPGLGVLQITEIEIGFGDYKESSGVALIERKVGQQAGARMAQIQGLTILPAFESGVSLQ